MNRQYLILAISVVIFSVGGFVGGMKYQQSKTGQPAPQGQRQNRFGGQNVVRPVAGEILSVDDKTIVVKLVDGSSKIVLWSDKTTLNKAGEATKSDLKIGVRVAAFGTANPDGSVTAQNVQINPAGRMGGGQ